MTTPNLNFPQPGWYILSPSSDSTWSEFITDIGLNDAQVYNKVYYLDAPVADGVVLTEDKWSVIDTTTNDVKFNKNIGYFVLVNGELKWKQLGQDIDGESGSSSGNSVSLSSDGTIVAIGAYSNDDDSHIYSGQVRVFQYNEETPTKWNQLGGDIDGEAAGDQSGYSVSLSSDGTIVAIGATGNDGNGSNSGQVRVFQYDGVDTWNQLGQDIDGEAAYDTSGFSVSLSSDGTIVAIGASGNDGNGSNSGNVRVFKYRLP